ncbi:hypothetical protein KP509_19G013800 [Ceratopteris richardii]|uniref:Uncharacterized protein n=2 Tax=Ceratopteris richardii TaxID=49495 RepID=A0A8T2SI87_CERRI|nr:hypothetical protein KP509_19G013800 [Ceratopteris richardii]
MASYKTDANLAQFYLLKSNVLLSQIAGLGSLPESSACMLQNRISFVARIAAQTWSYQPATALASSTFDLNSQQRMTKQMTRKIVAPMSAYIRVQRALFVMDANVKPVLNVNGPMSFLDNRSEQVSKGSEKRS